MNLRTKLSSYMSHLKLKLKLVSNRKSLQSSTGTKACAENEEEHESPTNIVIQGINILITNEN